MNKMINSVLIAIIMTMMFCTYSNTVEKDLQNNLVRLHIIANSDSEEDQAIKLKIRDEILHNENLTSDIKEKSIKERLTEAEKIANKALAENGFDYKASAEYGKFAFPKKEYKNMILPSGDYYGVRIVLGNGAGHNWWCVMYPPLCMMSENEAVLSKKSEEILKKNLAPETYDIIMGNDGKIKVRFKIVDSIQRLGQILRDCADMF